jgi:mono/diheme cytochrome c family protein
VPKDRPTPPPFEPASLDRSLDRYLAVGAVLMVLLIAGFITYKIREPDLRSTAKAGQTATYTALGQQSFETNCASCHGHGANGGSAPALNAKEFLKATTDGQIQNIVAGGITGSDMPAWSLQYGGQLTDEQVQQLTTYVRSLEADAPSNPSYRKGAATTTTTAGAG